VVNGGASPPTRPAAGDGTGGSRTIDLATGLLVVGLALGALFWLIPQQVETAVGEYDLSPAFFPMLAAWIVLLLALGLVGVRLARARSAPPSNGEGTRIAVETIVWTVVAVLTMIGLLKIGYLATSMVLVAAGAWMAGRRDWLRVGLVAILFPLAVNYAAWQIFTVRLP
jgi:hypothetical protein